MEGWRRARVAALLLSLALAACGAGQSRASAAPYRIGVVVSLTGSASQLGIGEANAARLAAREINDRGGAAGHRLDLLVRDDQSRPDQALQQARELLQQHVVALVGPSVVADCNAVMPLVQDSGPIDYCLSPGIQPPNGSYVWSASVATGVFARRMMMYLKEQGLTRVALVSTTDASGLDGARATRAAVQSVGGVQLVADVQYPPTAVEVTSQLQQVKAADPQAVVVWSTGTPAGVALKGLQQLEIDVPVVTTNGNLSYAFVQRIAAYAPRRLLIPATRDFWWDQLPKGSAAYRLESSYHQAYEKAYGSPPDFGPGVGYDAIRILADVLGRAGSDPARMRSTLQSLKGFVGVVGVYRFAPDDHRGLGLDDVAMVQVSNGGFTYVGR
ncbi:MAG TPA: ABC transporter substrate-binding protein [Candidatus Dormibacteraeota bacterium]|nr:ABC transporter substrate-binding protein [Candidatus Dormibacteraeota bacterium]